MKNQGYQLIVLLIFVFTTQLFGQGYQIKIKIDNLQDSTIYLGYYYGDKQYAKDTVILDSKGNGIFSGKDTLPGGVYFVLLPGNIFFELIVDKEQHFSVSTKYTKNATDLVKNLTSKGSADMDLYIDYQKFMTHQGELAINLRERLKTATNESEKTRISDSLKLLHNEVKIRWADIETNHPKSLIAAILKCNKEIDIPEPPRDEKGNIVDSSFQYRYYKAHYFDYVDFSDGRLLHTQFYHQKIDRYFEKMIIPIPDTVIKESYMILVQAKANEEVFKYTLQVLFNKYNNSNIMGMDKAFVFFADTYYLNGNAPWADSAWLSKVEKRVKEIKPNLIGNKAQEIRLLSPDDQFVSLYTIQAEYTVIFFFEPGCGHCKKATPLMKALADKYWGQGVEVLGIYTQVKKDEWLNYIKDQGLENWINAWDPYNQSHFRQNYDVQSTPSIYLLDKNKNIIGKRIDVETLDQILEDEFKKNPEKKLHRVQQE